MKNNIIIPAHELIFETSRSGGPGGQHVNKTESRVMLRWNLFNTTILNDAQKERAKKYFGERITHEGDLIITATTMRSQHQNKEYAYKKLIIELKKALFVPKSRIPTTLSKTAKERGLARKKKHSYIKKMRTKNYSDE